MIGKEVTFFSKSFYKSVKYKHVYRKKNWIKRYRKEELQMFNKNGGKFSFPDNLTNLNIILFY